MSNAGLFTTVAREYANFRPGYPAEMFSWLAQAVEQASGRRDAVWDCACGSGQASVALAGHFHVVHATDVAAEQIAAAKAHGGVTYTVAPAEHSGLPDASVDLVTVAQALHWFDVSAFYAEARRVLRPDGLLAIWNYPRPVFADPVLDGVFFDFYDGVVGPYWPAGRKHIEANYRTLAMPWDQGLFVEVPHPAFGLELNWSFDRVIGYVSSWSATAKYREKAGVDPVPLLREKLAPVWPAREATALLRMPLGLWVARVVRAV